MGYIIHYDIAAIFVCIVINVLYFSKKRFATKANRYFEIMCVLVAVATVTDTISVYTITHADTFPIVLNYIINGLFFLSFNTLQIVYFRFMVTITGYDTGKIGKVINVVTITVFLYLLFVVFFTPLTGHAFSFKNGVYHQGMLLPSLYIVAYVMLASCILLVMFSRLHLTLFQRFSSFAVIITSTAFVVLQFVIPNLLISNFAASLLLVVLYHSLQNPDEYLERDLKVFNQKAFLEYTERLFKADKKFSVLAFDMEGFAFVDQYMGVETGNELLLKVVDECKEARKGELYFLGGTQFVYICEKGEKEVSQHAEWLRWRFLTPFMIKDKKVNLTIHLCCIHCPEVAKTGEQIMTSVDLSLAECKRNNCNELFYATAETIEKGQRVSKITHILQRAIQKDEFMVFFQPIYSAKDHDFTVAEALVRLKDEEMGFIPPGEFIPIAEESGLILEIGEIVFRKVCEFIASGALRAFNIRYIEVNLSMVQCMQENLHTRMIEIMDEHKIPYNMIDFEITETSMNTNNKLLHHNMKNLIECGCTFAADDFGTGLSNADYLIKFPFEVVKLDRMFVKAANEDDKAQKVLFHTASMIGSLELKIVAEGVETKEQAESLLDVGCEFLQGFYFSPPIPPEEYIAFLTKSSEFLKEKMAFVDAK
ncbi:MAG: EAL domain-containing protein [Lachnospiraceae bacterium]|nr:EAL domain-containing protein [Lachnospiraceae bacterium]